MELTENKLNETTSKSFRKLTLNQLFNALDRDRVYQIVTEYKAKMEYDTFTDVINEEDNVYFRSVVMVKHLKSPNKEYTRQLLNALDEHSNLYPFTGSLKDASKKAEKIYRNNFGSAPTKGLFVVKLPTGNYILTDLDPDTLRIKLVSPEFGCLMVYMPARIVHFTRVKE